MEKRELGKSGIKVPPFCFGGNVFGWTADEKTSFSLLDALVEHGLDFIDTADVYSIWAQGNTGGDSERVIGKWLKQSGKRDKVIIASKVGMEMGPGKKGLSKAYINKAVEDSLQRLQTDYIDLYQSHTDDQDTPLAETLAAYTELIREGKVRAIGASNYKAPRLEEALTVSKDHGFAHYETLQPEYNLYAREDYETNLEPVCRENQLGVITYFSLASGFLTGKYRSADDFGKSSRGKGMTKYLNDRGLRILDALDNASKAYDASQASIALAWLMARPGITAPIASATSVTQLEDIFKSIDLKLSPETVEELNTASKW
jgi:aryl-alcohol dehydrogenase-like predicted oxidoreductase